VKNATKWLFTLSILGTPACTPVFSQTSSPTIPWCSSVTPQERSINYPPIARAAHQSGTVVGRLSISKGGAAGGFAGVFGSAMLVRAVDDATGRWKFQAKQSENYPCQILVIVDFTLDQDANPNPTNPPPNSIHIWINSSQPVLSTQYSKAAA
jgi:hypothetical protein